MEIRWDDAIIGPERSYDVTVEVAYTIHADEDGPYGDVEIGNHRMVRAYVSDESGFIGQMEISDALASLLDEKFVRQYPVDELIALARDDALAALEGDC